MFSCGKSSCQVKIDRGTGERSPKRTIVRLAAYLTPLHFKYFENEHIDWDCCDCCASNRKSSKSSAKCAPRILGALVLCSQNVQQLSFSRCGRCRSRVCLKLGYRKIHWFIISFCIKIAICGILRVCPIFRHI